MRCMGEFKDDRICDICCDCNNTAYSSCKIQKENRVALNKKLWDIESKCPYREECWEDYNKYYGCTKKVSSGRHTEGCRVTLECDNLEISR